ncbi:uncharacterized protein [Takifugu rubripes]|uniref:uncharacterized protein n=1 Tax=Takifugu rubripes TaxID=31033 RepID=UPI001145752E|nr:uncharacterized protein LOC115251068 [Takifugu rubripes]
MLLIETGERLLKEAGTSGHDWLQPHVVAYLHRTPVSADGPQSNGPEAPGEERPSVCVRVCLTWQSDTERRGVTWERNQNQKWDLGQSQDQGQGLDQSQSQDQDQSQGLDQSQSQDQDQGQGLDRSQSQSQDQDQDQDQGQGLDRSSSAADICDWVMDAALCRSPVAQLIHRGPEHVKRWAGRLERDGCRSVTLLLSPRSHGLTEPVCAGTWAKTKQQPQLRHL